MDKIKLTVCLTALSLLVGCTQNPTILKKKSNEVNKIETQSRKNNILNEIARNNEAGISYKIYVDDNDKVKQICEYKGNYCKGVDSSWNSFIVTKNNYFFSYYPDTITCGFRMIERTIRRSSLCDSDYYNTRVIQGMGINIIGNAVTAGFWFLVFGVNYEKDFDTEYITNMIFDSRADEIRNTLFSLPEHINGNIAIAPIEINDIQDDLDDAHQYISKNIDHNYNGLLLVDNDTNKPLSLININQYNNTDITKAVQKQSQDIFTSISATTPIEFISDTIQNHIPKEILLPQIPPVPRLVKSEYETRLEFDARTEKAVKNRENTIRDLQIHYQQQVEQRNHYIESLGQSWEKYLKTQKNDQDNLTQELKESHENLTRLLYTLNLGKFIATSMKYDAEHENLYFTAESTRFNFKRKMQTKVPKDQARNIKEKNLYKLFPKFETDKNKIVLSGFILEETLSNDSFNAFYTNIDFMPESISIKVASNTKKIEKEISLQFKQYQQEPMTLIDNDTNETWYIDTVKRINAKIPKWYEHPEQSEKIISYGEGETHERAIANARKELSHMIKTSISSSMTVLNINNTLRSYQDIQEETLQQTDVILINGDYSVYRQSEHDGRHYVGLCFKCN